MRIKLSFFFSMAVFSSSHAFRIDNCPTGSGNVEELIELYESTIADVQGFDPVFAGVLNERIRLLRQNEIVADAYGYGTYCNTLRSDCASQGPGSEPCRQLDLMVKAGKCTPGR